MNLNGIMFKYVFINTYYENPKFYVEALLKFFVRFISAGRSMAWTRLVGCI